MAEFRFNSLDRKWEHYYTDDEIKARAAAYAARPDVQARWADDARLTARTAAKTS